MTGDEAPDLRGKEAAQRVNQFRFSVELFQRNYDELISFIDYLCDPRVAFSYSPVDQKWLWYTGMQELSFLLHNFVAAAQSLVDHTRVLYRHLYEPNGVLSEYEGEVEGRFATDPLSQFVIKLRQMAQHYRLPSLGNTIHVSQIEAGVAGNVQISLRLTTTDLNQFGGWTAPAKQFMENREEVDLREVVTAYYDRVVAFHDWFRCKQMAIHGIGPDLYQHVLRHGAQVGRRPEVQELEKGIGDLERKPREKVTIADVEKAFAPVLCVVDDRRLLLCRHNGILWIQTALEIAERRFEIPDALRERILGLSSASGVGST